MRRGRAPGPDRAKNPQRGFSVLEAIAAVALIAVAFLPLLALQSRLAQTALAVERAELNVRNGKNALAYLKSINPMLLPEGAETLGDAELRWRATPVSEPRAALDTGGAPGRFQVQLFDIEAIIDYPDGRRTSLTVRALGWRAIAPPGDFLN